jgi:hypothetical protein
MSAHPMTITSTPSNAGQVGHPEYGRTAGFSLRTLPALEEELRRCKKLFGYATVNDLLNEAVWEKVQRLKAGAEPWPASTQEGAIEEQTEADIQPEPESPAGATESVGGAAEKRPTSDERDPRQRFWEDSFAPKMLGIVGEENFNTWLSTCRFAVVSKARCILQVPNQYFVDYLGENYRAVIVEVLRELLGPDAFLELEVRPPKEEAPKQAPPKEEEKPQNKYDQRIAILNQLRYATPIYAHYDATRKQLEAKWAEEDRAENPTLRQPGNVRRQRQYHQGNEWDPDP